MTVAQQLTAVQENIPKVYQSGYDAGKDSFWDTLQEKGTRTDYYYGFAGHLWTDETFKPKYPIRPSYAGYMFNNSLITDLSGVELDFSSIVSNAQCPRVFELSRIEKVGTVDLSNAAGLLNTFFGYNTAGASQLVTIGLLKLPADGTNIFGPNFFQNCDKLENITIEGVIGGDLDMSACPLSAQSVESVIDHLAAAQAPLTLTLSETAKARLTQTQRDTAAAKNWTIN